MPTNRRSFLATSARVSSASAALALAGCGPLTAVDHSGKDQPRFDANRKVNGGVAWVFGSGGPRGFVHIGVLKALEALKLKPTLIVGASVGSLVGALYASGLNANQLETLSMDLSIGALVRLNVASSERFDGAGIARLVNERVDNKSLEQLSIPFAAAVNDMTDNRLQLFNCGNTGVAVQASCAIPGTFAPVTIGGRRYCDADAVAPVPVRVARALGVNKVLAIDASAHEDRAPTGAERYAVGDRQKRELILPDTAAADLVLHPDFGYWVSMSEEFRKRTIKAGFEQTMAQAKALQALYGSNA
jgi:NTE family protein